MKRPSNLFSFILLALAFGALAGGLMSVVASTYLDEELRAIVSPAREVNLSDSIYERANLIIRDAKKVVVNQDVKMEETASTLKSSLVIILAKDAEAPYYSLDKAQGFGMIISNDGWVVVNGWDIEDDKTLDLNQYQVLADGRKMYAIEKVLPTTLPGGGAVTLIKLKGASGLPVRATVPAADVKPGTSIILLTPQGDLLPNVVVAKNSPSGLINSDRPKTTLDLAQTPPSSFKQSLAFTLNGDFLGWLGADHKLYPAYLLSSAWRSLVSNSEVKWPSLGVNYLDLTKVISPTTKLERGAWLDNSNGALAVAPDSAAAKAGLKNGDIIIKVNNQELGRDFNLVSAILGQLPGDRLILGYDRGGVLMETEVTLGELKL